MKYMLDTNICIYLIKQKPRQVLERLQKLRIADVCISSITLSELEYGVEKSERRDQNRAALTQFIVPVSVSPYDEAAAEAYGKIRSSLERKGLPLGSLDVLIAAHALSLKLTLVTNNVREFKRIPELKLENWI